MRSRTSASGSWSWFYLGNLFSLSRLHCLHLLRKNLLQKFLINLLISFFLLIWFFIFFLFLCLIQKLLIPLLALLPLPPPLSLRILLLAPCFLIEAPHRALHLHLGLRLLDIFPIFSPLPLELLRHELQPEVVALEESKQENVEQEDSNSQNMKLGARTRK